MDTTIQQTVSKESCHLAVQIMAGLLASGHYTELDTSGVPEGEPRVRYFDNGSEWKEEGELQRCSRYVVGDAIMLLSNLRAELAQQAVEPKPSATRKTSLPPSRAPARA